jgi:hypothetical protein
MCPSCQRLIANARPNYWDDATSTVPTAADDGTAPAVGSAH